MEVVSELIDRLRGFYYRFRKPQSIPQALNQLFSPAVIKEYLSHYPTDRLIEQLAKDFGLSQSELLSDVAARLGLIAGTDLVQPNPELIQLAGGNEDHLRRLKVLPQRSHTSRAGYALAVADLSVVDTEEYRAQGIPLILAADTAIEDAWKRYDWEQKSLRKEISEAQIFAVLTQLARDAHQLGSQEVFVGHPKEDSYEFLAQNKLFSGKLHPLIYHTLLEMFRHSLQITKELSAGEFKTISFSLTRNFERPVVCLTWECEAPSPEIPISDIKTNQVALEKTVKPSTPDAALTNGPGLSITSLEPSQNVAVLLVEDDSRFALILAKILENKGFAVTHAANGEAALFKIQDRNFSPELIISDVHMPQMDGATLLRHLRDLGICVPVLMLTSDDDHLLEAELALLGADAFVRKQDDPRILFAWCNRLLRRRKIDSSTNSTAEEHFLNGTSTVKSGVAIGDGKYGN